jgi:hypothetical protein
MAGGGVMSAYKVIERYKVIKGGTSHRWRAGDIWEVIQYPFEEEAGDTHLCRNRTGYLNGRCLAAVMSAAATSNCSKEVRHEPET